MRRRTSPIWEMPAGEFRQLVESAKTYGEIFEFFGFKNRGNHHRTVKRRMRELGISGSHLGKRHSAIVAASFRRALPLEALLVKGSKHSRSTVKRRVVSDGLLPNRCAICGSSPEWMGKPMVLILDHVNGVSDDDRLENLRLLCPNCNSQLPTHCGGVAKRKQRRCWICSGSVSRMTKTGLCARCVHLPWRVPVLRVPVLRVPVMSSKSGFES